MKLLMHYKAVKIEQALLNEAHSENLKTKCQVWVPKLHIF